MWLSQPNRATGYVSELLQAQGAKHFVNDHKLEPYYASALAHWKLENMFQTRIERDLKPARWYLLMAFRHLALDGEPPTMPQAAQAVRQGTRVRKALEDDAKAFALFRTAAELIRAELGGQIDRDQLRGERPLAQLRSALKARTA